MDKFNQKQIEFISKSGSSIRSHSQNPNQIEIDDRIWLAWNPKRRQFVAGPLIALACQTPTSKFLVPHTQKQPGLFVA